MTDGEVGSDVLLISELPILQRVSITVVRKTTLQSCELDINERQRAWIGHVFC